MSVLDAILGVVFLATWYVACERLIVRDIDRSLLTPFEAARRAKREKCHD